MRRCGRLDSATEFDRHGEERWRRAAGRAAAARYARASCLCTTHTYARCLMQDGLLPRAASALQPRGRQGSLLAAAVQKRLCAAAGGNALWQDQSSPAACTQLLLLCHQ